MAGAILDSHQHYWRLDRGDYDWLTPDLEPLRRDFLPEHLAPLLAQAGVGRTVLVQAARTEAETRFLLDLAGATPSVAGVVGWADLWAPDAPARIAALAGAAGGALKGVRVAGEECRTPAGLADPALDPAMEALAERGLTLDALVEHADLPGVLARADRSPGLAIILDHAGAPGEDVSSASVWAGLMRDLAAYPHMACKFSGLAQPIPPEAMRRRASDVARMILDAFGARRVLWGSDWPVVNLHSAYPAWLALAEAAAADLSAQDRAWLFAGAARAAYRLDPPA